VSRVRHDDADRHVRRLQRLQQFGHAVEQRDFVRPPAHTVAHRARHPRQLPERNARLRDDFARTELAQALKLRMLEAAEAMPLRRVGPGIEEQMEGIGQRAVEVEQDEVGLHDDDRLTAADRIRRPAVTG